MTPQVPLGSRPAARVLLFGPTGKVLLLHASLATRPDFWVCPGGGVEQGESFEQAACRELLEETGLPVVLGPQIWYRHHIFAEVARHYDLFELFFVGRTTSETVTPQKQDGYVDGHRWWTVDELLSANAEFAPRRLQELIAPIVQGNPIAPPFDCGI